MSGIYDDIIDKEYPWDKRMTMDMEERAKIFLPFAALKGYEEAIAERIARHIEKEETGESKSDECRED